MLLNFEIIKNLLPIVKFDVYYKEHNFLIQNNWFNQVLTIFKNHFRYQFKILTCISGIDYPENLYRFSVIYELLSIKYNSRLRLKVFISELIPMSSIEKIFKAASWWECEIWDMFGIFFLDQSNLTRLLTDYGFQGYPLRKDFPLSGFVESRFNVMKSRVVSENIELAQEYRIFEFISTWENYSK
jgi:NADH:ubiquinone oxidoreductase subunit C